MLIQDTAGLSTDEFFEPDDQAVRDIRAEVIAGLQYRPAHTSPKYFYDVLGSKLFEAICELPEYYPTRVEAAIFENNVIDIARSVGRGCTLIDLGAGNCEKAARLFPAFLPAQYVAIDISLAFLRVAVGQLRQRFPQVAMTELGMDFSESLEMPHRVRRERRLFFYPGSSIGNFAPPQAVEFLRRIRSQCQVSDKAGGGLLIGVDLVKDKAVLDAAYDDALGVTASFNLNLLLHLNRLLDADFNLREWQHRGFFDVARSRIEMHLVARHALTVSWPSGQRHFARGESIHTESSYKYTQAGFLELLAEAGFGKPTVWTDPDCWFMVCHAQAQ